MAEVVVDVLGKLRKARILVVDDEELVRSVFVQALRIWGYEVCEFDAAEKALGELKREHYDIALTDLMMPGHDGLWLLQEVQRLSDAPSVIIISGHSDVQLAIHSLTHGAFDFLIKPVDLPYLKRKIESALDYRLMREEMKRHTELLEEVAIRERRKSQEIFLSAIDALIRALEAKDDYTQGHSSRVAVIVEGIAQHAGLSLAQVTQLVTAARCHDIGKIGVRDLVLLKEGRLSAEEFDEIKRHPVEGARILAPIFKELPEVILAVRHHHERYDGQGYPDRLRGENIPQSARFIAIADAFDAMTSNRVYRRALTVQMAVKEIIAQSGRQFCPMAVKAFITYYTNSGRQESEQVWIDQRKERRYDCTGPLTILDKDEKRPGTLVNVSFSGIQFELPGPLDPAAEVSLQLAEGPSVKSKIHWSTVTRQSESESATTYRCGASVNGGSDYRAFVTRIAKPASERRLYHRLTEVIEVELLRHGEHRREVLLNLSAHGAFIQMRQPWALGAELTMHFHLDQPNTGAIRVAAKVNRRVELREALLDERAIPGIGVSFSYFLEGSPRQIINYIDSNSSGNHWPIDRSEPARN